MTIWLKTTESNLTIITVTLSQVLLVILLFLVQSCGGRKESSLDTEKNIYSDSLVRKIYSFQDERKGDSVVQFFNHPNSLYRHRAALAFASIQDTLLIDKLKPMLGDKDPKVRNAAAYALGQTRHQSICDAISEAIKEEKVIENRIRLLEALGKSCTYIDYKKACGSFCKESAVGLFQLSLRKKLPQPGLKQLINYADSSYPVEHRIYASVGAARSSGDSLSQFTDDIREGCLQNKLEAEVLHNLILALGKCKLEQDLEMISQEATSNPDYRVRISALRALNNFEYKDAAPTMEIALKDKSTLVRYIAASYFGSNAVPYHLLNYTKWLNEESDVRVKAMLWSALLSTSGIKNGVSRVLDSTITSTSDPYAKAHLIKALAKYPSKENYRFLYSMLQNKDFKPIVHTTALETVIKAHKGVYASNKKDEIDSLNLIFNEIILYSISSEDASLIWLASDAISQAFFPFVFNVVLKALETANEKIPLPIEIETKQAVQKAIASIKGEPSPQHISAKFNNPIDWDFVVTIPRDQQVRFYTSKGNFILQLMVNEAPGTVANFVKLVEKKFYDNHRVHRVVPNFVMQDGCPRGDGWGGTEFTIRSEWVPLHYSTGTVGVASAGKDTESCQWFITHVPTPHLEGRYTIFAKVISGMDVVHQIDIGDKIISCELIQLK